MLHSWSFYPSTLSCTLCLRLEKNKYTFGSVGVFHQQGPCTWSLPCLFEQVHFEQNMKEFYNSQTPPSEELGSTSTNTLEILDTQAITALRCLRTQTTSTTNYHNRPQQNQGRNQQRPNYSEAIQDALSSRSPSAWWTSYKHSATLAPVSTFCPGFPKGVMNNLFIRVGTLYTPADFMMIETGTDERAPIILGRLFLNTSGAVIYTSATKISFYIKGRKETFSFKNKTTQISKQSWHEPRKGPTGGTGTSKCGLSQLRWSLLFKEIKIVNSSRLSWSRRMTLVFQASSAQSTDDLSIICYDHYAHKN